jgi:hypothetical protein
MLVERLPLVARGMRRDGTPEPALACEVEPGAGGEVAVTVTCTSDEPVEAGVRVELRLDETDDPRWLIPGVFYGENRPAASAKLYPRFVRGAGDADAMESDTWSFRADRCATPAVFARGGGLVTQEASPLGQAGVGLAYREGRPVIWLDFPYREEPLRYDGSNRAAPPDVRTHRWQPGEQVILRLKQNDGDWRRALRPGDNAPSAAWVPVEEAAELAAWGLYRWHYRPEPARLIETAAFDRSFAELGDRDAMHVSWVSGVPYAYALLLHGRRVGNENYAAAAEAVLDHVAANLTPGGTFWSQWTAERGWTTGWHPDRSRLHARTLADAALFMRRAGGRWEAAARSNVTVAVRTQREDGALPTAHHVETGQAVAWDGTAGLAWIPALVEAGELAAARAAGEYYRRFVEAGFLFGAPEDVDLGPTSEDGYAAVMAYVALEDWETARRAADWMLTFRYSYDVAFSPHTILGHYGFRSRGADNASPANPHLHAFGLICLPELVRLARATGDDLYLTRACENFDCFRQFIAREDGDFGAQRGMATERYYQTDVFGPKGDLLGLSHAWSVGVLLYACEAALKIPELA